MKLRGLLTALALAATSACQQTHTSDEVMRLRPDGSWVALAPLPEGRAHHTTTVLPDGRIVVTGGVLESEWRGHTASVIIYSPGDDAWHDAGTMLEDHAGHRAFLVDGDHLLIIGGRYEGNELLDLAAGTSVPVTGDPVANGASIVQLADGSVLAVAATVVAENNSTDEDDAVRILDPGTSAWRTLAPLDAPVRNALLFALPSGKALWLRADQHRVFDPSTETFEPGPAAQYPVKTGVMLSDGTLLTMYQTTVGEDRQFYRYDPGADIWTEVDISALPADHVPASWPNVYLGHERVALADGTVAIVRGSGGTEGGDHGAVHVYRLDPATGEVTLFEGTVHGRNAQGVVAHPDGGLLFVGGLEEENTLEDLES